MNFSKGPSLILNSGSLNASSLTVQDKFGKYSTGYVVGKGNRSFIELKRIIDQLIKDNKLVGVKMPWIEDENTGMVSIFSSNKKVIPVLTNDDKKADAKLVRDGQFCKLNVTPAAYCMEEVVAFRLPDGSTGTQEVKKTGVKLFLNGIKLLDNQQDEELF